MDIIFRTKEESNKAQQKYFLNLSKEDRIYAFLRLMEHISKFPTKAKKRKSDNFIIKIPE